MLRLLLALALVAAPTAVRAGERSDEAVVRDAFHFAFPVYELARTRHQSLSRAAAAGGPGVNRLIHRTQLSDHTARNVTTPNNDTLYSHAWLDLAASPILLSIPALPDRYHSVALMDVFGDNFAVLGTRATGGRASRFLVVGPEWKGRSPRGSRLLRAPTNDVWLLLRVLVDGTADLPAARLAQSRFIVTPIRTAVAAPSPAATADASPDQFLSVVNRMLGRSPLPPVHARRIARFAPAGVRPGRADAWAALDPETQSLWRKGIGGFRRGLADGLRHVGAVHDGWSYPKPGIGVFGADDLYRARVALGGLGALPSEEAVYLSAGEDADGRELDGRTTYRLRIPARVPMDGFWSLSLYEIAPDGRLFFTDNPIGRYAIGNRTSGLLREPDGSIVVSIQRDPPSRRENWLPTPSGPFRLTFRAYLPRPELRSGRFRLPPVEPTGS